MYPAYGRTSESAAIPRCMHTSFPASRLNPRSLYPHTKYRGPRRNSGPIARWTDADRAVLHFLSDKSDQRGYVRSLRSLVRPGGHVIIAAFSLDGADRCSGLDVRNYEHHMISVLLGPDFTLKRHFAYLYRQPSGDARPYLECPVSVSSCEI